MIKLPYFAFRKSTNQSFQTQRILSNQLNLIENINLLSSTISYATLDINKDQVRE